MRRAAPVLVAATAVVGLASCGVVDDLAAGGGAPDALPVADAPLELDSLPYVVGNTLHADGREVDLGGRVTQFVVGPRGVYADTYEGTVFTDLETVTPLDVDVSLSPLVLGPEGETLALVDFSSRVASAAVYDLESGDLLNASTRGMGDPVTDDLGDLYEETWARPLGFTADAVVVEPATGPALYLPLDGGAATEVPAEDLTESWADSTIVDGLLPSAGQGYDSFDVDPATLPPVLVRRHGELSPDRTAALVDAENHSWRPIDVASGTALDVDLPDGADRFVVATWTDEHTVVGGAALGRGSSARLRGQQRLVSCVLEPGGRCTDLGRTVSGLASWPGRPSTWG
ncbi:hypothetical protein [Nocardioides bruguierae]|uniref:Uncharacterized protein n=1 Tax=Nocardioides bruguierae TaxID=2945102 RepID=A0A9X2D550_9ACTN|nr:hypothetical protein [Nocardioides bruguierae]MCM0619336.1 hypothetical protein [Nocardioides bruguierae]